MGTKVQRVHSPPRFCSIPELTPLYVSFWQSDVEKLNSPIELSRRLEALEPSMTPSLS